MNLLVAGEYDLPVQSQAVHESSTCRSCGAPPPFRKSHIIPEAFFRQLRGEGGEPPLLVSSAGMPKRAPIGVYDPYILCPECETRFGEPDDYGIDVLLKRFTKMFVPMVQMGRNVGWESATVDARRLLRFLISILWRASVSTQDFYRFVSLGRYERDALELALSDHPKFGPFDAVLSIWHVDAAAKVDRVLLDPRPERWGSIRAYRVYLGGFVAYVKADSQPFERGLAECSLLNAPRVRIVTRDLMKSKDYVAMIETAERSHAATIAFQAGRRFRP